MNFNDIFTYLNSKYKGKINEKRAFGCNFLICDLAIFKGVLKDIYKVFDAQNSYFNVQHLNKSGKEQTTQMLNLLNVHKWIVDKGRKVLKNKPNSIVVIDKDGEGNPFLIFVDSSRLIDLKIESLKMIRVLIDKDRYKI